MERQINKEGVCGDLKARIMGVEHNIKYLKERHVEELERLLNLKQKLEIFQSDGSNNEVISRTYETIYDCILSVGCAYRNNALVRC